MLHSRILTSLNFNNKFNLFPRIWEQPYIEMLFRQLSNITTYIRGRENCQTKISIYCYFPIQETMFEKDVKLQDIFVPYFQQKPGSFPLDGKTMIHWNVGPPIFQQPWYMLLCWKNAWTTFQCMIVLQSRGNNYNYCWHFFRLGSQSATYIVEIINSLDTTFLLSNLGTVSNPIKVSYNCTLNIEHWTVNSEYNNIVKHWTLNIKHWAITIYPEEFNIENKIMIIDIWTLKI